MFNSILSLTLAIRTLPITPVMRQPPPPGLETMMTSDVLTKVGKAIGKVVKKFV